VTRGEAARATDDALALYGITWAGEADAARARARRVDPEVRVVTADPLAALVRTGTPGGDARDALMLHFDLLAAVAREVDVLPMTFGVMAEDEAHAGRVLADRSATIQETLSRIGGKVEMRVRAQYRQDDVLRDIVMSRPDVRRLSTGARGGSRPANPGEQLQLGRLVVGALEQRRRRDARRLLETLAPMATDVRTSEPSIQIEVLRASFLVNRWEAAGFREAAESAEADGVQLLTRVTGPVPPWSFVGDDAAVPAGGRRR